MEIREYILAQSLEEAYALNQKKGSRILGGGLWLRLSQTPIAAAIDLGALGLDAIEESATEFSIGAMVSLRALETHPGLNAYTRGAAAGAVASIVGVQFRNMATVGGSIFGRFGFSDVLTLFLALDARVELYRTGAVPLEEFVKQTPGRDILVRLTVKKRPGDFAYLSARRSRTDFPVLTCALSRMEGEVRAVYGARPARAMVLRDETGILSRGVTPDSARLFAQYAAERVPTGSNSRGSAAYRTHLIEVLTRRGLLELEGGRYGN